MSTKRKKSYVLLAIAGVLGLALDRLVVSDVETSPATVRASAVEVAAAVSVAPAMPELPFPKNLEPYSKDEAIRDIFAIPIDLQPATPPDNTDARRAAAEHQDGASAILSVDQFRAEHHLDGLLNSDGLRLAIVNGRWLRVGQLISGCTLERIFGTSAHFRCNDGRVELQIGRAEFMDKP